MAVDADTYRRDIAELANLVRNDIRLLIGQFDSPVALRSGLIEVLPELMNAYGSSATTIAADWYDELRDNEGVPGRFRARAATLPDTDRTTALARWGVAPLFSETPNFTSALSLIAGGMQRIIADAGRQTVARSSVEDPRADGWQRVGNGANCTFCAMLIGRGAVYRQSTAAFASHDHCNCAAAPAFTGRSRPVKPYTPSLRDSTEADRERVREYIRTH